jgi:hypothetical protein
MSILSKLKGAAQGTAASSARAGGRSTTGKGLGGPRSARATTGRGAATGGGFKGFGRGKSTGGRGRAAPATSGGGLGKLIGSFTGRR